MVTEWKIHGDGACFRRDGEGLLELDENTTNDDNDDVNDGRMEDTW